MCDYHEIKYASIIEYFDNIMGGCVRDGDPKMRLDRRCQGGINVEISCLYWFNEDKFKVSNRKM